MPQPRSRFLLRMAPSIYGPSVLFSIGEYAILPLIPVLAVQMGAGLGLSGLITSAAVIGQLAGSLPASWVVARWGEQRAMLVATGMTLLGCAGLLAAPALASLLLLTIAVCVVGFAGAAFSLARHALLTTHVPLHFRARALSLLGGTNRLGRFVGPFLAAGLITLTGSTHSPVWAFIVCLGLVAALVLFAPNPEIAAEEVRRQHGTDSRPIALPTPQNRGRSKVLAAVKANRTALLRVGGASAILSGLRSVKDVLIPLWGVSIGLDATQIALIVGISGTIDFALFYTSGQVMDRFGRLWASLPATVVMALSFGVLSFTHDLADAERWLLIVAIAVGLGNGLSSGINMTLGADLAPRHEPAPFLAAWRTLTDFGGAVTPIAVSTIALVSLPAASAITGGIALAGAVAFARWIPRYIPRRPAGQK